MDNNALKKLWAYPQDIKKRQERIEKLRRLSGIVSDTVQGSSNDNGYGLHTIRITGLDEKCIAEIRELERQMEEKNQELQKLFPEAVRYIEEVKDPDLRIALHVLWIDGGSYKDVVEATGKGDANSWRIKIKRFRDACNGKR